MVLYIDLAREHIMYQYIPDRNPKTAHGRESSALGWKKLAVPALVPCRLS